MKVCELASAVEKAAVIDSAIEGYLCHGDGKALPVVRVPDLLVALGLEQQRRRHYRAAGIGPARVAALVTLYRLGWKVERKRSQRRRGVFLHHRPSFTVTRSLEQALEHDVTRFLTSEAGRCRDRVSATAALRGAGLGHLICGQTRLVVATVLAKRGWCNEPGQPRSLFFRPCQSALSAAGASHCLTHHDAGASTSETAPQAASDRNGGRLGEMSGASAAGVAM